MKAILLIALFAFVAAVSANYGPFNLEDFSSLWSAWKTIHQKVYSNEEDAERFLIFVNNYYRVKKFNQESDSAQLALNKFADLTKEEFKAQYTGSAFAQEDQAFVRAKTVEQSSIGALPVSVDWRTKGAVTPIKDQGQCGSCWTFSTTGVIEGFNFLQTGSLLSLSEQQIVDCDTSNSGCDGGWPYLAIQYAAANGLELESDYPYTAQDGNCAYDQSKANKVVGNYAFVTANDTNALKTAIVGQPVSVLIEADEDVFQLYNSGVIKSNCGASIDHAVLAVGYSIIGTAEAYIVKNSWGTSWGQSGYVYISTNGKENQGQGVCGILYQPVIATK